MQQKKRSKECSTGGGGSQTRGREKELEKNELRVLLGRSRYVEGKEKRYHKRREGG